MKIRKKKKNYFKAMISCFCKKVFEATLRTEKLGRKGLVWKEEVTSTMDEAMRLGEEASLVVADVQTAGRGREKGRKWRGKKAGKNLYFTMRRECGTFRDMVKLNLASAIANRSVM